MQAGRPDAARRSWMDGEARARTLPFARPTPLGQIFRQGFMRGSMLQMAVCSPPRHAATQKYDAVLVTELGAKATARSEAQETVEA